MRQSTVIVPLLCLLSAPATADWYEATGQAVIRGADRADARAEAVQDAVRKALLYSGASVRSVQQVTDGLLTQETLFLQTQGEVQNVQIISETEEHGYILVTIRADIFPDQKQCSNVRLKKLLMISPFQLSHPEQAITGQLYELGSSSTQLFIQKLQEFSHSSTSKLLPQSIRQTDLSYQDRQALQRQYGSPYLLRARLEDVSLGERVGTNWSFWSDAERERFYRLELELLDIQQQKQLFSQTYQTSAIWDFQDRTVISPHSQRFWRTGYGKSIDRVLNAAAQDIEEVLRCESVQTQVVLVDAERLMLNAGSAQGLKIGDELTVLYRRQHKDSTGQWQDQLTISDLKLKITELSHQSAWAEAVNAAYLANVQVGDLASPEPAKN
ncbi:flagellar assembly protein T N-terminal domain-containing protein [Rheinheimera sp.]|uniref:flagellar assembly protein T N-terminal domain-containing protein n=1 Tax=Rheinheimera sp. TaxID=1869214 RepID=UPI00307FB41F